MNQVCKAIATAIAIVGLSNLTKAFVTSPTIHTKLPATFATNFAANNIRHYEKQPNPHPSQKTRLYNAEDDDAQDNEIERLKKMAAKLRAEAAALEADKAKQLAEAAERAFRRFDIDSDGVVNLSELKLGLEKELKASYSYIVC